MIILTTTYNCENYIERCLLSIMGQKYKDYHCFITDDKSDDKTVEIVKKTISSDSRFTLIENETKQYQPGNYNQIIRFRNINENEICIEVDGDDWLPNSNVFHNINEIYKDENVWMTSGSFKYHDGRTGFANPPTNDIDVRKQIFTLSHLRTWKAWLWNKIDEKDLKDEDGKYWDVAGDLAFMFPMFEMSGMKHYRFLKDINYIYNESNPLNDHKVNMSKVIQTVNKIRSKKPYLKL